ncbi:MAG: RsmB/NOP family class I SAM-dependent RNA methyltransferase [Pseudomonadota bacterium]
MTAPPQNRRPKPIAGQLSRDVAVAAFRLITTDGQSLDQAFTSAVSRHAQARQDELSQRDRAFARAILLTSLRHANALRQVAESFAAKGLPPRSGPLAAILITTSAQLLLLDVPAHAAINVAVSQAQAHPKSARFAKLANAILHRVAETGATKLADLRAPEREVPQWMFQRWTTFYGEDHAHAIAAASLSQAALDLTVKPDVDAEELSDRIGAVRLPTGSLRLPNSTTVLDLEGYDAGWWWVQDTAAALPARLMLSSAVGLERGARVLDLCAAPGGKTAQLAAAGMDVTALDRSKLRLETLAANHDRLKLSADVVVADALTWSPKAPFDAILLDAPCSATGTLRRHPDILHTRTEAQIAELVGLQTKLLNRAVQWLKPGGHLVYCTCSLERDEGEFQIASLLNREPGLVRRAAPIDDLGLPRTVLNKVGEIRTRPDLALTNSEDGPIGLDGFFVSWLQRADH